MKIGPRGELFGLRLCCLMSSLTLLYGLTLSACQPVNPLVGKWLTPPPSNLLFEYKADGTVHLLESQTVYQVFRYKLIDRDTIMLVDGMGRIRYYDFKITGKSLIYSDPQQLGVEVERLTRQE